LSPDELTAYVAVGIDWVVADINTAKRGGRMNSFGSLVPLDSINSPWGEDSISVTGDGLTLFVESNRDVDLMNHGRIYRATRPTTTEQWTSPTQLSFSPEAPDNLDDYVLPDGAALYFTADVPGNNGIYRAALSGAGVLPATPILQGLQRFPVVSPDELTLYFASGYPYDIWMATRTSRDLPFGEPVALTELNSDASDNPQWISPDGCRLYFGRATVNEDLVTATSSIYVAERAHD
jgi:Tol biopolymer transport system component